MSHLREKATEPGGMVNLEGREKEIVVE